MSFRAFVSAAGRRTVSWGVAAAIAAPLAAAQTGRDAYIPQRDEVACAPTLAYAEPATPLRLVGTTDVVTRLVYAPGQTVIVGNVENQGVATGQLYFVRRIPRRFGGPRPAADRPAGVHTAGWIRILAVSGHTATATVVRACDGLLPGDYLEPYLAPLVPRRTAGPPRMDDMATLLTGDEERALAVTHDPILVDRGAEQGLRPGDTFVVFRVKRAEDTPAAELGEGIVLTVLQSTATVQITRSRDAVMSGDRVAFRR
jgi:hypothetical protein